MTNKELLNSELRKANDLFDEGYFEAAKIIFKNIQENIANNDTVKDYINRIFLTEEYDYWTKVFDNRDAIEHYINLEKFYIDEKRYEKALEIFQITNHQFAYNEENYSILLDLFNNNPGFKKAIVDTKLINSPIYSLVKEDLEVYCDTKNYVLYGFKEDLSNTEGRWVNHIRKPSSTRQSIEYYY